jgi:hypothetical protein
MYAPKILAGIPELVEYYTKDLARLRLIARNAAVAKLWIRSRHGTWRFFRVIHSALVEIDREGKRIETGRTVAYMEGVAARTPSVKPAYPPASLKFSGQVPAHQHLPGISTCFYAYSQSVADRKNGTP